MGTLEGSLADQGRVVMTALSEGRLTPDEATAIMQAISTQARIVEMDELEKRIAALESKTGKA